MANKEHLAILEQGVDVWNAWREASPQTKFNNISVTNLMTGLATQVSIPVRIEIDLSRLNLNGVDLNGIDLSNADLTMSNFEWANLSNANLRGSDLRGTTFTQANLSGSDLSGAYLHEADLSEANLTKAKLDEADLMGAILSGADLEGASLTQTYLMGTTLMGANLRGANLQGADLTGANLSHTSLHMANLTGCRVHAVSAWDVLLEKTIQADLIITDYDEPTIRVDDLEVAQFIYLLLNHKKLHKVFNAMTARGVLILGRFSGGGLEVLQAIAAKLREEKYLPIIFDFERPQGRNYTETVKTLAGLARFIIADLSGPSVPQELYATVPHFKIPFVPIIEASRKPYSMAVDLLEYPWVVRPPITFATTEELLEQLPTKVIAPAEEKHQARQKLLDELFNQS